MRAICLSQRELVYAIVKEHCGFAGFSQDPGIACVVV